jgi:hypothetical protein
VITWALPQDRGHKDRHSRVRFDIETISDMERKVSLGWPRVGGPVKAPPAIHALEPKIPCCSEGKP